MMPENQHREALNLAAVDTIGDGIGSVVSGMAIPEPMQRDLLKVVSRLCSALIEVPAAVLEGFAAEKRAESQARVQLISATAEQLASQLKVDPRLVDAASIRYGEKIVRQQVNLKKVMENAVEDIAASASAAQATTLEDSPKVDAEIDEDWLNIFESEAAEKSSEQMQMLFGKILAGELRRPKSFSIKTLRLMGQLDSHTAQLFRRFCSVAISLSAPGSSPLDVRVCSLGGNAASNAIRPYGFSFDALNLLHENGLIISDYNSYMEYGECVAHDWKIRLPLVFEGQEYGLVPKEGQQTRQEFRIHGVALSRVGRELFPIVEIEPDARYSAALREFFDKSGFTLQPVGAAT